MPISISGHLRLGVCWCRDHRLVMGCGTWADFSHFHSNTYMQVCLESFVPTKLLGWLLPCFTLILAKSTEVALQTQHSKPTTEFLFKQLVVYEREVVSSQCFPVISLTSTLILSLCSIRLKPNPIQRAPELLTGQNFAEVYSTFTHFPWFLLTIRANFCWLSQSFESHTSHPVKESQC